MPSFNEQHAHELRERAEELQNKPDATMVERLTAANTLMLLDAVPDVHDCEVKHAAVIASAVAQTKKELKRDKDLQPTTDVKKLVLTQLAGLPPWAIIVGWLGWQLWIKK